MIRSIYHDLLFLGDALDARNVKLLFDHEVQAVVDVAANEAAAQLPREIIYCRFPLLDGDGNSTEILQITVSTVVRLIEHQFRTLVVCSAGMSRSPTVAAMALALITGEGAEDCLKRITEAGPHDVSPLLWLRMKEALKLPA